ncbi:hypothetical protein WJ438_37100 [Streptomyces sp. GD-15H]
MESFTVVPRDPLENGPFDLVEVPPRALMLDQFGLERFVQSLDHRVIVRVCE